MASFETAQVSLVHQGRSFKLSLSSLYTLVCLIANAINKRVTTMVLQITPFVSKRGRGRKYESQ